MISYSLSIILERLEPGSTFRRESEICVRSSAGRAYFCKSTTTADEQFRGEAESLKLIHEAAPGLAPGVLFCDLGDDGQTYMISEYIELEHGIQDSAKELATRLATELHESESSQGFGFGLP